MEGTCVGLKCKHTLMAPGQVNIVHCSLTLSAKAPSCGAGVQSDDAYGSPTYPSSQPGYLRHRPSLYQKSNHMSPAETLFSKEILEPPSKTGAASYTAQ